MAKSRSPKKPLRVEIEGTVIQNNKASDTYVDAFNLMYKKRLIDESILSFNFVKESKSDFPISSRGAARLIEGSKNLWITSASNTEATKIPEIKQVFDKYKINGTVEIIDKAQQSTNPIIYPIKRNVIEDEKINTIEIPNTDKIVEIEEPKTENKKPANNILKQAICIIGDSGVGKSVRIKKTLEGAGHEKLVVILDSLWSHLLFDYIPETRKYELTKIGAFIKKASEDVTKHFTIVIDECHKNLEIVNDSLLQAISTNRNEGKRFLSLNTFGDKLFNFLPEEDGNRILPDNLGFVFISSKRDVVIEGNPDLKNRVEEIELTRDDWQDESYSIEYLLGKIKKEEPGEYIN